MADFRIHFYGNLSTLLSAGLPILRALRTAQTHARFGWRKILARLEQDVSRGTELSESMSQWPRRFSSLDLALVRVGEQTGQLAELFKSLAEWYELRRKLKHVMLSGMMYPLFVLHLGAMISPVPGAVLKGGWESYWYGVFGILSLFYIPLAAIIAIRLFLPKQGFLRRIFDEIILPIPVLGAALKCLAVGRFSYLFSMMYKAGVPIMEAARLAIQSCGNLAVRRRLEGGYTAAKQGSPMSQGFSKDLYPEFLELWAVGEESGELDKTSAKLGQIFLDKAQFRFEMLAQWLPKIVYFAIMAFMAYQVIKGFQTVYGQALTDF
jgi:type II secretory pathway component PulF